MWGTVPRVMAAAGGGDTRQLSAVVHAYEPLSIIWPKSLVLTMNCEFAITITAQKVV